MGIKQLFKFVSENAPKSVIATSMDSYTGRTLAIDASTCLYQFLIAVRTGQDNQYQNLTNAAGEVTSHITGFLSRTLRLLEAGVKPVFVFDGKPPDLKKGELEDRRAKKEEAEEQMTKALESGDQEALLKATKRSVRADKKMHMDCIRLLRLLGCCIIEAPCEAEASCAALVKANLAYAAVTEDMDCLTFATPRMVKNLFSTVQSTKGDAKSVSEIDLRLVLDQLNISFDQFIDFCILCGCDYCGTIKGVGPSNAFKLVVECGSLENILAKVDKDKLPAEFPYEEVRNLFRNPEVVDCSNLKLEWPEPDYDGLRKFLVEENQFNSDRVEKSIDRLKATRKQKTQMRLDSFFGAAKKEVKENEKFNPFASKRSAPSAAVASAKKKPRK